MGAVTTDIKFVLFFFFNAFFENFGKCFNYPAKQGFYILSGAT